MAALLSTTWKFGRVATSIGFLIMTAPSVSLGFSVIQATRCLLKPWCSASSNTGRRSGKPAWTASRIIESSAKARVIRAVNVLQPIRVSVQVGVARNPSGLTVWKEPLLNSGHIVVAGGGGRIEGQPLSPLKAFAHIGCWAGTPVHASPSSSGVPATARPFTLRSLPVATGKSELRATQQ
jgi:hypothetical protein